MHSAGAALRRGHTHPPAQEPLADAESDGGSPEIEAATGDVHRRPRRHQERRPQPVGLSLSELELVMRPFEQAPNADGERASGTGLGLPLSREFAEMHGGTLDIASVKGEGCTVTFWLPASRFVDENRCVAVA